MHDLVATADNCLPAIDADDNYDCGRCGRDSHPIPVSSKLMTMIRGRATIARRGSGLLPALFALVAFLVAWNAMEPWGMRPSFWIEVVLQAGSCMTAIAVGLVVARRVTGWDRLWRLIVVGAVGCWLVAQALFWRSVVGVDGGPIPDQVMKVAHYGFLMVMAIALVVLAWSTAGSNAKERRESWTAHAVVVLALDGLVAAAAYAILVWSSRASAGGSFAIARSGGRPDGVWYPLLSLLVVTVAVLLALGYREGRRHRANFLLLVSGLIVIAAADRVVAYLVGVGFADGQQWARMGFVFGPLLIALAFVERPASQRTELGQRLLDWTQTLLPYLGSLGIAVLIGFHVLVGQRLDLVQTGIGVLLIFMLVGRHVMALQDNRQLIQRVYAGQRRLIHQLHHDPLTGLPNRMLFMQRLDAAIEEGRPFLLVYIDLDDFKDINDRHGHAAGDRLLTTDARARQSMRFLSSPLWRAYTSTYVEGYRLLRGWLDARPGDVTLTERFTTLLDEPLIPSALRAA